MGQYRFRSPTIEAVQFRFDSPRPPRVRVYPADGAPSWWTMRKSTGPDAYFYPAGNDWDSVQLHEGDWVCWMDGQYWWLSNNEFIEKYERIGPEPAKEENHRAVDLDAS